jgi:hypothetical protein
LKKLLAILLVAIGGAAVAQSPNSWQVMQPWRNNYIARTGDNTVPEDLTDATFALLMDEASGSLVDEIGGVTLIENNAGAPATYSVTGSTGYDPGITMAAADGGFRKTSAAVPALDFGTGNGNVVIAARSDGAWGTFAEIFGSHIPEIGTSGFNVRGNYDGANGIPGSGVRFYLTDTDTNVAVGTWVDGTIGAWMYTGGVISKLEFQVNRTADTVELFVDDISQGTQSIALVTGTIQMSAAAGINLGQDYRAGIDRDVPVSIFFVRVKKSLT